MLRVNECWREKANGDLWRVVTKVQVTHVPSGKTHTVDPNEFVNSGKYELIQDSDGKIVEPPKKPEPFSVGSLVRLKCGGPVMVVHDKTGVRRTVKVYWHNADGHILDRELAVLVLDPVEIIPDE